MSDKSAEKGLLNETKYLDANVLQKLRKPLPTATRQGRGGQVFEYIPTKFVSDRLNDIWGIDWHLEIMSEIIEKGHVVVKVRIHYPKQDGTYGFKDAYGGAKYEDAVGLGDCLKKSASLALKKAATLLGIDLREEEPTPATDEQKQIIATLMKQLGNELTPELAQKLNEMPADEADALIEVLKEQLSK